MPNANRSPINESKCTAFLGVAASPDQVRNYANAARVATGGNLSKFVKRELDRSAARILRRQKN